MFTSRAGHVRRFSFCCAGDTIRDVTPHVLALVEDLFFLVQIQDAAKRAGCTIEFVKSPQDLLGKARECAPSLVVVDLTAAQLQPLASIAAAKSAALEVLAFVPHVQVELKQQALKAGADTVVARSNFSQHLQAALETLSPTR